MEIMATANNHNQKELRLYAPNEQQQTANATTLNGGARSPFQREVREWQRIDPDTGALLTGRLEADRWINGPLNKYGKISDSQNISQPNGTQQTQRKQLEVLQTCTPNGGAMQVIRSQTVQTTSSRWSTSSNIASPLLLSANTSPIPITSTTPATQIHRNKHNSNTTNSTTTNTNSSSFTTPLSSSNGFNHHQHLQQHYKQLDQLRQQQVKLQQFPNSFVNVFGNSKGISSSSSSSISNKNWPDLTKNMSILDVSNNDHGNEHDHDNGHDYIVEQQSTDNDNDERNSHNNDNISLIDYIVYNNDQDHNESNTADDFIDHQRQYLLNKRNNLKNVDLTKRHSFTLLSNDNTNNFNDRHDHNNDSHHHHQHQHQNGNNHSPNNLSRDSSSGSCSNSNNQLFLLDTAPSLKLSNLMKSSSSLSNSSNNSTTASQATTTTTATNITSLNTHKPLANTISLHAIVGSSSSGNNNNNMTTATTTATTTSLTPSPTTTTARTSWQQPTLYRQNSNNSKNFTATHSNLMKSRVGDNNNINCCTGNSIYRSSSASSSSDESRPYTAAKTETDLRHLQIHQQNTQVKQNDRLTPTHMPHSYQCVDLESFRHYHNNNENNNNNNNSSSRNSNNNISDTDDDGLRLSNRHQRRQQIPSESSISSLQRSRSISTDDLSTEWDANGGDSEEPAEWRRVSKLRRSFQSSAQKNQTNGDSPATIRRPLDLPTNSVSVSKIRAELENGRRLNTVMRNNHVDLAALSNILNGNSEKETKSPLATKRDTFLTAESLKEIRGKLKKLSDESLYKEDFIISQQTNEANPETEHLINDQTKVKQTHTTNSLESRLKYKDTQSVDWHTRRKSYGFEKMSPPEKEMLRMDASTDSGLGRSGELQNWSPTCETPVANRTVVHFGETGNTGKAAPLVQRRYRPQKSYEESDNSFEDETTVSKRHSIAVDESQYVRDSTKQTTQIHINGFYEPGSFSKFVQSSESTTTTDRGQQKRVEFSKTEVHFATESGRVNIVETDSKPPPTNNFRRRRSRNSSVGPLQSLVKSATTVSTTSSIATGTNTATVAMPVTLFGDDNSKKKTLASTTVAYRAPLVGSPEPAAPKDAAINVTVTVPTTHNNDTYAFTESSRSSYVSTSGVDTTDCDTDEMTSLRGILKNKPAKPKPYVLGENIDKPDELWGVQLKPVTERAYKSESPTLKSVAERIQELGSAASAATQSNGFSTKINVSLGSTNATAKNWDDNGLITNIQLKPNVQEMLMHDLKEHQKILDEGLKSTTLIIRTLRSANEFDEAMRRLSIASIEAAAVVQPKTMLRSNSYQETTHSLDYKELKSNDIQNIYKSTSFSSTSSWSTTSSTRKYSQDSRKTSTDSGASFMCNGNSATRLSFLGNEQIPVSQQLQRLRQIYDAAANRSQDEDSADEEVKSYFKENIDSDSGGGTQDSSSYEDDLYLETTNSWSRLKAKKTVWKINTDTINNDRDKSIKKSLDKADLPKSNIMSIKLHSPQATTESQQPPIAKPRTITVQETSVPKIHTATTIKQAPFQTSLPTKDSLKIVKEARGARQLREHELSYFGLPVTTTSEDEKPKTKYATTSNFRNSPKRSLPLKKLSEESSLSVNRETEKQREQWQLESDKPDLLKHNPIEIKPTERTSLKKKAELNEEEEHLYENIANDITPVFKVKAATPPKEQYDRKMDLKRDFEILNEMNQNADQTLRELSDEAALKDRRRRSLQRRNSKPLATIDEKSIAERINDSCIAVKISRSTYASESRKSSRHSTPSPAGTREVSSRERSSSQSSVECCPRARSRSLSSEKEYDVTKSKAIRTTQMVKHKTLKPLQNRSSSLDSQRSSHSQYSSGDEPQPRGVSSSFRREDRSRTKTKRITSSATASIPDKNRGEKLPRPSGSTNRQQNSDSKHLSSTTSSSKHRERVECKQDKSTESATTRLHSSGFTSLQRSTNASSSGRRHRDDVRDSQRNNKRLSASTGRRTTAESLDKHEQTSSKHLRRSLRDDGRNSTQRSSSNRLERSDKEKEKDKTSRSSKGHSSRSISHQHHERDTPTESQSKQPKTKSMTATTKHEINTNSSKNAHQQQQPHQAHHASKDGHKRANQHKTKRDENQQQTEHIHGLKSAIIKTTTKLRDKSRSRKEKK